eukprot:2679813-Rhodomonas_salina.2
MVMLYSETPKRPCVGMKSKMALRLTFRSGNRTSTGPRSGPEMRTTSNQIASRSSPHPPALMLRTKSVRMYDPSWHCTRGGGSGGVHEAAWISTDTVESATSQPTTATSGTPAATSVTRSCSATSARNDDCAGSKKRETEKSRLTPEPCASRLRVEGLGYGISVTLSTLRSVTASVDTSSGSNAAASASRVVDQEHLGPERHVLARARAARVRVAGACGIERAVAACCRAGGVEQTPVRPATPEAERRVLAGPERDPAAVAEVAGALLGRAQRLVRAPRPAVGVRHRRAVAHAVLVDLDRGRTQHEARRVVDAQDLDREGNRRREVRAAAQQPAVVLERDREPHDAVAVGDQRELEGPVGRHLHRRREQPLEPHAHAREREIRRATDGVDRARVPQRARREARNLTVEREHRERQPLVRFVRRAGPDVLGELGERVDRASARPAHERPAILSHLQREVRELEDRDVVDGERGDGEVERRRAGVPEHRRVGHHHAAVVDERDLERDVAVREGDQTHVE